MGTTFEEIYEEWMLPIINDYKLDALYIKNKEVLFEFLKAFLKNGLGEFDCIKPLTYHSEVRMNDNMEEEVYFVFDNELDSDEKNIISKIAVANYFKRQVVMDLKARLPYMQAREFKKDALAPLMKQNDLLYKEMVSEYMADIAQYNMKHISDLPYWGGL